MQAGITVDDLAGAVGIPGSLITELHSEHTACAPADTFEETFIAALKAGSESAFAQLIALYHQPVFSLVARSLQDPADAADITQEVFIKIYRGIRTFHGDSSLRTWIYRIALHEASNQRRWWSRHKRQEITLETDISGRNSENDSTLCLGDTLADSRSGPYDIAAQNELRATVSNALSRVPEVYRHVLVLREIEGCSYDEIAAVLNIQVGTVKSRLMRGRQALRLALTPQQPLLRVKSATNRTKPANLPNINLSAPDAAPAVLAQIDHAHINARHIYPSHTALHASHEETL